MNITCFRASVILCVSTIFPNTESITPCGFERKLPTSLRHVGVSFPRGSSNGRHHRRFLAARELAEHQSWKTPWGIRTRCVTWAWQVLGHFELCMWQLMLRMAVIVSIVRRHKKERQSHNTHPDTLSLLLRALRILRHHARKFNWPCVSDFVFVCSSSCSGNFSFSGRCRLNRAHGPGALFHIGRVVPSTGRVHPCVRMARASVSDGCFRPSVLRQVSGNNVFPQVAMLPNRRWAHVAGSIHPGAYFDGNKHLSAIECSITQT